MDILNGLNPQQLAAVTAEDKQILVVAGAGSGKTKVLVSRIAWLMAEKGVRPGEIMAVTFTNKATREMKERIEKMTGLNTFRMWIGTFHALCARLLRMEGKGAGLSDDFVIYDTTDCRNIIKSILASMGLDEDKDYHPASVAAAISDAKNRLMTPRDCAREADDQWKRNVAEIYRGYQLALKDNNALDFDDLLTHAVWLLEQHPDVLAHYRARFRHILVDEYQDTNHCQYRLVRLLAGNDGNLFAVGDPDQSIYRWRGADISNILDFSVDYPACRQLQLTQNYRSTQHILDVANDLITHNRERTPKDLFTEAAAGEPVVLHHTENDKEEAAYVIRQIMALQDEGYALSDVAVLYRTHSQSRLFEDICVRYGVPYRIFGGMRFYDRKEVKDTLAYIRLLVNPNDGEALNRIYNEPRRGIGKTTWDKLTDLAAQRGCSLWQVLANLQDSGFATAARTKLERLYALLENLRAYAAQEPSVVNIVQEVWRQTGYQDMILLAEDSADKMEILEQLVSTSSDFDALYAELQAVEDLDDPLEPPLVSFLSQVSLATDLDDADSDTGYLTLMTLHAAKGLEFPVVFLVGMEEGLFPHRRSLFSGDEGEMEEERRLCYVGITRARERLFFTAAGQRYYWGRPEVSKKSRFLEEINPSLLKKTGVAPMMPKAERTPAGVRQIGSVFKPLAPQDAPKKKATEMILIGDRLRHSKFGDGVVVALSGSGDDLQVTVAFPDVGVKNLMWKYAPMKKI